jgi:hypothetical protein
MWVILKMKRTEIMKLLISYIRAQVKGVAMGKVYRTHET